MIDRYTKIVLTVIALALAVIAVRGPLAIGGATAINSCGSEYSPCHMIIDDDTPVTVIVKQADKPLSRLFDAEPFVVKVED
jgi:hypothetical protein